MNLNSAIENVKYVDSKNEEKQKEAKLLNNTIDVFVMPHFSKLSDYVRTSFREIIYRNETMRQNGYKLEKACWSDQKYIILDLNYDSIEGMSGEEQEKLSNGYRGNFLGINECGEFVRGNYFASTWCNPTYFNGVKVELSKGKIDAEKLLENMTFEKVWSIIYNKLKAQGLSVDNPAEEIDKVQKRIEFLDTMNDALENFKKSLNS